MTSLKSFYVSMLLTAAVLPSLNTAVRDVAMYMDSSFVIPSSACADIQYLVNDVEVKNPILTYWVHEAKDAAKVWEDITEENKTTCVSGLKDGYILSLNFGDDTAATWKDIDATDFGAIMTDYLPLNKYNGLDFTPDNLTSGCLADEIDQIVALTKAIPTGITITHSPMANYFSATAGSLGFCAQDGNKSYYNVETDTIGIISKYYVQYYNVDPSYLYFYYELIFEHAGDGVLGTNDGIGAGSAVCEIVTVMPALAPKIVVGKPLAKDEIVTSGYVTTANLHTMTCTAETSIGYPNGLMFWKYQGHHLDPYDNITNSCLIEGTGFDCNGVTTTIPPTTTGAIGALTVSALMTVGAMGIISLF